MTFFCFLVYIYIYIYTAIVITGETSQSEHQLWLIYKGCHLYYKKHNFNNFEMIQIPTNLKSFGICFHYFMLLYSHTINIY